MVFYDPLLSLVNSPLDVVTLGYIVYEVRFGRIHDYVNKGLDHRGRLEHDVHILASAHDDIECDELETAP